MKTVKTLPIEIATRNKANDGRGKESRVGGWGGEGLNVPVVVADAANDAE